MSEEKQIDRYEALKRIADHAERNCNNRVGISLSDLEMLLNSQEDKVMISRECAGYFLKLNKREGPQVSNHGSYIYELEQALQESVDE